MSWVETVWIIDNGSTDGTIEVAAEFAAAQGMTKLQIFRNRENVNLGGTHKAVFEHARALEATHILVIHGDDQARASEIDDLLAAAQSNAPQTILGSRFSRGSQITGYDWRRILGNRVLNALYSVVTCRRLQDLGSGLNLFHLGDLDAKTYVKFGNKLSFNYELTLDLVRRKVDFAFHPISWSESDQTSNARNFAIFAEAIRILVRWRFKRPTSKNVPDQDYEWEEVG